MPWAIAFLLQSMRQHDKYEFCKYMILFQVVAFFSVPGFELFPLEMIVVAAFLIFSMISNRQMLRTQILNTSILGSFWIILNVWWIVPLYAGLAGTFAEFQSIGTQDIFIHNSLNTTILNLFLLAGWAPLYQGLNYPSVYPWSWIYQPESRSIFLFLAGLIPVTGLLSLRLKQHSRKILFIFAIFAISLIPAQGAQQPSAFLNQGLLNELPPALAVNFREPGQRFGLIIAFTTSLLFALGISYVRGVSLPRLFRSKRGIFPRLFAVAIVILVVGIYAWPMWTGDVVPPVSRVQIPQNYQDAIKFFSNDKANYRVLSIPFQDDVLEFHNWQNGVIGSPIFPQFGVPTIISLTGVAPEDNLVRIVNQRLYASNSLDIAKAWGMLNAKYVALQTDKDWSVRTYGNESQTVRLLSSLPWLVPVWKEGSITIYKNELWYDRLYTTDSIYVDNSSFTNPIVLSQIDRFQNWTATSNPSAPATLTALRRGFDLTMNSSNGVYAATYASSNSPLSISGQARYVALTFRTNVLGSMLVQVQEANGQQPYLVPLNPPSSGVSNHYQSTSWYTIFYDLRLSGVNSPITNLYIYLTNRVSLSGPTELQVENIQFDQVVGSMNDLVDLVVGSEIVPNQSTFFSTANQFGTVSNSIIDRLSKLSGTPPHITYIKNSPTEYQIHVSNADHAFVLTLGELFDPGWQAFIDNTAVTDHFTANLAMNGWLINRPGSFVIDVKFANQTILENSEIISTLGAVALLSLPVAISIRRQRTRWMKNWPRMLG
jgi:hypothetical protein